MSTTVSTGVRSQSTMSNLQSHRPPTFGLSITPYSSPFALSALPQPSGVPAWRSIPSFYLVGTIDNVIPPFAQLFMAQRANANIVQVRASHLVMISHPNAVVGLIDEATLSLQGSLKTSSQQTLAPTIA